MIQATQTRETNAEYHADLTHYSHSMLEVFYDSPKLFYKIYIKKSLPRPPKTPPIVMGSLVHCLVLEPEDFDNVFLVADCDTRRGKKWTATKEEAASRDLEPIPTAWLENARAMAKAVEEHALAARLLSLDGDIELPIRWEDESGLLLKCKPDLLTRATSDLPRLYTEFKSAAKPKRKDFTQQASSLGYYRQVGHYVDGAEKKHTCPVSSVFIVVGSEEPHDVFVYRPSDEFVRQGQAENIETLANLANAIKTGVWQTREQGELISLGLSNWVRKES